MVFQNRRHGEKLLMIVASMLSFSTVKSYYLICCALNTNSNYGRYGSYFDGCGNNNRCGGYDKNTVYLSPYTPYSSVSWDIPYYWNIWNILSNLISTGSFYGYDYAGSSNAIPVIPQQTNINVPTISSAAGGVPIIQ
ncbi:unnamed protein product [Enterobius vermicularis]|uniref:Uncharacterized protein n=1 Tax=Enterobius vermicularis TaxID=51028 RepID=A0A0N4VCU2_ENTVE|nr:unnamed protein product [Enterobius vermicularis]